LKRRRWFGGKARAVIGVEVAEVVPMLAAGDCASFVVEVSYADGQPDRYHVPLLLLSTEQARPLLDGDPGAVVAEVKRSRRGESTALLLDAFRSPEFCRTLFGLLLQGEAKHASPSQLRAELAPWMKGATDLQTAALPPRLLATEQSNTCVVFGDQFILKVFRRAEVGRQPDQELGLYLAERAHFPNTPRLAGWLDYRSRLGDSTTFAVLHEYVTETRSAWEFAREDVKRYFERSLSDSDQSAAPALQGSLLDLLTQELPARAAQALGTFPAFAELLGRRIAEMHLALAADGNDEAMRPEPYGTLHQRSIYQSLHNLAQQVLRDLNRWLPNLSIELKPEVAELLHDAPRLLACFEAFRSRKMQATRIRHHGDLHLGQVLHTGKDVLIIDFEGEPARPLIERLRKRSAVRDVAGMLRSFHYAAASTLRGQLQTGHISPGDAERLEAWAELWYRAAARAFLGRYLETAAGASFIPADRDELAMLLDVFLLEKALYEVSYELNNRPTWLPIPLAGIRSVMAGASADWRRH
jgi:maltose alpha-D-glucosyltransferase/alpha-amylase